MSGRSAASNGTIPWRWRFGLEAGAAALDPGRLSVRPLRNGFRSANLSGDVALALPEPDPMRNVLDFRPVIAGAVALLAFNAPLLRAQDRTPPSTGADVSEVRRTLTLEDYGGWKRIQGARLAPDGRGVS
jgi:hypothetical protein